MINAQGKKSKAALGQTLIETLAAAFILVMGITAAAGLAIYAFGASTNIVKQIIATGLAREGVEAVKNMRDTNWLRDTLAANCWDYKSSANTAFCYKNWLNSFYDLSPPSGMKSYVLSNDAASQSFWVLSREDAGKFGLNKKFSQSDVNSSNFIGFFESEKVKRDGDSDYYREIEISEQSSPPFDHSEFHRLLVKSRVWWVDKKCPRVQTFSEANAACKVELQYYLTNWKNY